MTLAQLVDEYLLDVARLYQPATERKYGQILKYLLDDLGDKTPIETITESQILASLVRWRPPCKPATLALSTSVYKKCFAYGHKKKYLPEDPAKDIERPKLPRAEDREVLIVSTDDIRRMFSSCQNWGEEICLGVLAYTGSRRSAVSMIRWKDVDLKPDTHAPHGWMRMHEKGNKVVDKPIPFFLREIIDRAPAHDPEDYLVPNRRPNAVKRKERSSQVIYSRVKDIAERAGVEAHVHAIRAAFAVFFLETHRGSIKSLQMWLGHERLETTQHYTRGLDKKQLMAEGLGLDWGALTGAGLGESGGDRTSVPSSSSVRPVPVSALSEGVARDHGSRGGRPAPPALAPSESTLEVEERVS